MIVRGAFNHILRPGLRPEFRDSYQQYPEEFPGYLKTGTQDRAEVEAVTLSGLPRMALRGEAEAVTYIDPVMSDKVVYIDDEFALGFIVSKRMMEDDLYNKAKQNAKWLGRSARLTQEYLSASLLDDAFAGSVFTGLLGESLISTAHTRLNDAGTWSNRLATDVQLGITGLQASYDLHAGLTDHQGDPIVSRPSRLVIDISDEWVAIQLTQNPEEAFTTDRNINAFRKKSGSLSYMVAHYKAQDGAWLFQDPNLIDMHFLWRVRPEFEDTFDFDTKAAKFSARQRINVYFFDQRGVVGSEP